MRTESPRNLKVLTRNSHTVAAMSALEGREVLAGADEAAVVGGGMIWTRVMGGLGGGGGWAEDWLCGVWFVSEGSCAQSPMSERELILPRTGGSDGELDAPYADAHQCAKL